MKTINNINLSDIFGGSEPDVIPEVAAEADISDILKKKKNKKKKNIETIPNADVAISDITDTALVQ